MASIDDKLAILTQVPGDDEGSKKSTVLYFRPDKLIKKDKEEEKK